MNKLAQLMDKKDKLVIGLMSGTSADGIDAVLVQIQGWGMDTRVHQREFITLPFPPAVRERILTMTQGGFGGSQEMCQMHFLLGKLYADACITLCDTAGIAPSQIDLVGSHGQTVFHIPQRDEYLGFEVSGTLQIGEPSLIAEALGCVVVSDFRVRDMAADGQGAPLVPYTEYLMYRDPDRTIALQNLGGIGNITLLPQNGGLEDVLAFDTGPANVLIDAVISILTEGEHHYDKDGALAAKGSVHAGLMEYLLDDPYLSMKPPKTTGREHYNHAYVERLLQKAGEFNLPKEDIMATVTRYTAETIRIAVERFCPIKPQRLIVGGGGSQNPTLLKDMQACLPSLEVLVNEDIGFDSNSKEAVAFAILANEAVHGVPNNAWTATGAKHPVVMGKISV